MSELAGRTALVTGGGTGIGTAVAIELGRMGARVILSSRDRERLEQAAERMRTEGLEAEVLALDLRSPDLEERLRDSVAAVDILVNNAAVFASYGAVEEVPLDQIDDVFEVDLRAALRLVRHVLPAMKDRGWGRIVNIGSVAGSLGAAGQVAYSTAKAGLRGLTTSAALEGGPFGVTSNLVEPGLDQQPGDERSGHGHPQDDPGPHFSGALSEGGATASGFSSLRVLAISRASGQNGVRKP